MTCDPKTAGKLPGKLLFSSGAGFQGKTARSRESAGKDPLGEAQPCLRRARDEVGKGKLRGGIAPGAAASAPGIGKHGSHGKRPTGISQNQPFPSTPGPSERTLRGTERSAPTPKSLTPPRGCPLGTPRDPCPALHQHPAKIPARSTRFCLPAPPCLPTHTRPPPRTGRAPPISSQTFISDPPLRSSCWERLSCPLEQPRVGDARSAPQRVEEPSGGHGGDTGGAKISPKLPSKG